MSTPPVTVAPTAAPLDELLRRIYNAGFRAGRDVANGIPCDDGERIIARVKRESAPAEAPLAAPLDELLRRVVSEAWQVVATHWITGHSDDLGYELCRLRSALEQLDRVTNRGEIMMMSTAQVLAEKLAEAEKKLVERDAELARMRMRNSHAVQIWGSAAAPRALIFTRR